MMIDSGAARSVCPESYAKHVILSKCNDGISLVGANGGVIETYGKRRVGYRLKDGRGFSVDYTVAKVRRPVVSVSQAVDRGMSWVFSPAGSFMVRGAVSFEAQHKVEMIRVGDLYFVDADSFAGLGEKEIMPVQVAVPVEAAAEGVPEEILVDPAVILAAGAAVQVVPEPEPVPRHRKIPVLPSAAEQQAHALTHLPSRSWCPICVQAKGIDDKPIST